MVEIIPAIAAALVWMFVLCVNVEPLLLLSERTSDWWLGLGLFTIMVVTLTVLSLASLLAVLTYVWLAGVV